MKKKKDPDTNSSPERNESGVMRNDSEATCETETMACLLAGISHEISAPIQTITGMLALLSATSLDREQIEYTRQIKFSAEVLLSQVNDILDHSKITAGKTESECIDFDLERTLEQAAAKVSLEAHRKGLYIVTVVPPEARLVIRGDSGKFRRILINLVKNAVKFTNEGGVTVKAETSVISGREVIRVFVIDTGTGIKEEAGFRLFGDTGSGLAISHDLVKLMGGSIEMAPNEKGGSVFHFDIPLARSDKLPESLPLPERNGNIRILIVDDNEPERSALRSMLHDLGYSRISLSKSGLSALKMMEAAAAEGRGFHICFIDMIMPVMDGWRLASEIHNSSGIELTNLVLMVPHGLLGADGKMTLLKWFRAYIYKPINRRNLAETVSFIMNDPHVLEVPESNDHITDTPVLQDSLGEESLAELIAHSRPRRVKNTTSLPVLIVEDHPVNQRLFSLTVEKLGYDSILANNGIDALEKAGSYKVSLVFMDLQMPGMNGFQASEKLREKGFRKPIIAVAAGALADEFENCRKSGMDDILVKPFRRSDIRKMLHKWIKPRKKSVFNTAGMFESFTHNEEIALPLLARFIKRTEEQISSFPDLEKAGDWDTARREAHTIKGAALTMGGVELGKAASRLELAFKNIDKKEMKAAYPPVKKAFERFKADAEDFLDSRK